VGTAQAGHPDRGVVDLLFFPTGGGKTEAYLGLAAFAMVLRRLRDPSIQSAGVSVLMRYTLRLLTLDQLGRAATLICALELIRQDHVDTLGRWPFEIGLWVGRSATPNRMGQKGDGDDYSARQRALGRRSVWPGTASIARTGGGACRVRGSLHFQRAQSVLLVSARRGNGPHGFAGLARPRLLIPCCS